MNRYVIINLLLYSSKCTHHIDRLKSNRCNWCWDSFCAHLVLVDFVNSIDRQQHFIAYKLNFRINQETYQSPFQRTLANSQFDFCIQISWGRRLVSCLAQCPFNCSKNLEQFRECCTFVGCSHNRKAFLKMCLAFILNRFISRITHWNPQQ